MPYEKRSFSAVNLNLLADREAGYLHNRDCLIFLKVSFDCCGRSFSCLRSRKNFLKLGVFTMYEVKLYTIHSLE